MPFATAPDEFMRTTPPKIFTSSLPGYSYPAAAFMIRSCWYGHVPGSGLPVPAQALIPTPHAGSAGMEFPITAECYVGARYATAHEECRGPLEYKYNAYASWGLQNRSTQGSFEDFARDRFIIGDKGSVKEEIARYREVLGVDHFIMRCEWPGW